MSVKVRAKQASHVTLKKHVAKTGRGVPSTCHPLTFAGLDDGDNGTLMETNQDHQLKASSWPCIVAWQAVLATARLASLPGVDHAGCMFLNLIQP